MTTFPTGDTASPAAALAHPRVPSVPDSSWVAASLDALLDAAAAGRLRVSASRCVDGRFRLPAAVREPAAASWSPELVDHGVVVLSRTAPHWLRQHPVHGHHAAALDAQQRCSLPLFAQHWLDRPDQLVLARSADQPDLLWLIALPHLVQCGLPAVLQRSALRAV